jgi:Transposase-associated domain
MFTNEIKYSNSGLGWLAGLKICVLNNNIDLMIFFFRWIVVRGCMEVRRHLNIGMELENSLNVLRKIYMKLKGIEKLLCPCLDCHNVLIQRSAETVQCHLIRRGFKTGYTRWVLHGEITLNDGNDTNELDSGSNNVNECESENV